MSASSGTDAGGPARFVAVLAGGASTRMGAAKAALELGGRSLISYPVAAARAAGLEPFVVAKRGSPLPPLDCRLVTEPDEPRHPLTGVIAAIEHTGAPIVVLPCDAPLVPTELIATLAEMDVEFAMPGHPRPQPLIARYSVGLLPRLREARDASESLISATSDLGGERMRELSVRQFGDPELIFANANSHEDLARIEQLLVGKGVTTLPPTRRARSRRPSPGA